MFRTEYYRQDKVTLQVTQISRRSWQSAVKYSFAHPEQIVDEPHFRFQNDFAFYWREEIEVVNI